MVSPSRKGPLTPLDALRVLLGDYADGDPSFPSRLTQMLQKMKKQALAELGGRLSPVASSRGLRKAILACSHRFDWPEWVPWLVKALPSEPDLGVFDDGCAVLGLIGTRDCLEALQGLRRQRTGQDHQVILARELAQFQPQQGFAYYLGRLLEGQGNPRLAAQGAKLLSVLAGEEDVPAIADAYRDGDPLTRTLALRLMGSLPFAPALEFLLDLAEQTRRDFLDHQQLLEQLNRLHTLPRASTLPELTRQAAARFGEKEPKAIAALQQAAAHEEGRAAPALEALRGLAQGVLEQFLVEALSLVTEGKVARYSAMISEASQSTEARLAQLVAQCDQLGELLAFKVDAGSLALDRALPVFAGLLRARAGSDGFIQAFLRLLPADQGGILDELLADPDLGRREQYLDALGAREDDALTPFFLKAILDPIVEVGQRAIHHLGRLPSSFPALMELFHGGNADQVRMAIGVFRENRTQQAAEPLLEFLRKETHDLLLVDAAEAIAAIGCPGSAPVLLELLHDGKPLNLQLALARALKQLGTEDAALGLLARAAALKQPQVLILALEGALTAFPGYDHPLPLDQLPAFLALLDRCCDEREGEGQRQRAMLALQDLYVFDMQTYERLKERCSDYLFDMRTKEAWDRDSNDRMAEVVKELARRAESLGALAQKETSIQGQIQRLPAGPKRIEALLALRETLQDPGLILRPRIADELAELVLGLLRTPAKEWRETAHLCEIGGLTHRGGRLIDPIREVYRRATGLGLKSAARAALLALGLAEEDLNRRAPIRTILVLEPSAFFRKRLAGFLASQGQWELEEAGSRQEAEAILARRPMDLVLTESHDAGGDLTPWLEQQWAGNRCRHALVSTSNRDIGELAQAAWVIGVLFKPFPLEQVIRALAP
jgi:HEAT repeat protein